MMDSWVPMGEEALAKYREVQARLLPMQRCPGCDTADGDHYLECPVGVHQTALALLARCPAEALAQAEEAALEWAEAWMDPWCVEARHWRLVADEVAWLQAKQT